MIFLMTQQTTPVSKAQSSSPPNRSWLPVVVAVVGIVEAALSFLIVGTLLPSMPDDVGNLYFKYHTYSSIDWEIIGELVGLVYLTVGFVICIAVTVYAVRVYRRQHATGELPLKQERMLYRLLAGLLLVPICFYVSIIVYARYAPPPPISNGSWFNVPAP
jgi:hypothetical protein